ncbi:MAG: sulfatase [Planctomycetes bacterium]|nr:sulfatase [Planctomycetota bacterium]
MLALLAAVLGLVACGGSDQEHPNVIVIVVDTLRADRLGCYGYPRPITPEIDELAKEGLRFEDCVAQAPWTLPSMSSMLTGRYVTQHREWPDPAQVPLAECFQTAGYATVGVSANVLLAKDHDFDRGYDHYDASFGPVDNDGKPFDQLYEAIWPPVEKALATKKPLFLFVQPFDPHFSYKTHPQYDAQLPCDGAEPVQPAGWQQEVLAKSGVPAPENDPDWGDHVRALTHLRGQYEQEVRFTDEWLGKTLARLDELGVLDDAVVAIVSDHGEGLWEHVNKGARTFLKEWLATKGPDGYFFAGHAHHVYEEAIRTPMILWGKGVPRGARSEPVENLDLYPTLCALARIDPPKTKEGRPQLQGRDLTPLFDAPKEVRAGWRDHTFSLAYNVATVRERSSGLKLVVPTCSFTDVEQFGTPRELFHLPSDPHERTNLVESRPQDVERLLAALQKHIIEHPTVTTWGLKKPDEKAVLKGLGYLGFGEGDRPNPSVICDR